MQSNNLHKAAHTELKNGLLYRLGETECSPSYIELYGSKFIERTAGLPPQDKEELECEANAFDGLFSMMRSKQRKESI